jgi:fatty acid desaturase
MEKNNKSTSLGFGPILFLIFLTLKLAGLGMVATWSWWWVFSPILIPLAAIVIILLIVGIATYINDKY